MFYKFYYLMLQAWILDFNTYRFFLDMKTNRVQRRLPRLQSALQNSNHFPNVEIVQALPSHEVNLLQFVDVLIGSTGSRRGLGQPAERAPPRSPRDRRLWRLRRGPVAAVGQRTSHVHHGVRRSRGDTEEDQDQSEVETRKVTAGYYWPRTAQGIGLSRLRLRSGEKLWAGRGQLSRQHLRSPLLAAGRGSPRFRGGARTSEFAE